MANKKLTEKQVWAGTFKRSVALMGLYFFSSAITLGLNKELCLASFIVGGLYYFTEILKFYGMDFKKIASQFNNPNLNSRKKASYSFLLWA
jgi:hypothetical protein